MNRIDLLKQLPRHSIGAEIGVFEGEYSEQIIDIVQPSILYLVDLWPLITESGDDYGKNVHHTCMWPYQYYRLKWKFRRNNVQLIKSDSYRWLRQLPAGVLDWVYIDANHNYENVKNDIAAAKHAVRQAGFIGGHDYDAQSVKKAVNESFATFQVFSSNKCHSFLAVNLCGNG